MCTGCTRLYSRALALNHAICSLQGIKLYYRVLETMIAEQAAAGGTRSAAALLKSDAFHRSLLALAFEMVVASYRMVRFHTAPY